MSFSCKRIDDTMFFFDIYYPFFVSINIFCNVNFPLFSCHDSVIFCSSPEHESRRAERVRNSINNVCLTPNMRHDMLQEEREKARNTDISDLSPIQQQHKNMCLPM